MMRFIRKPAGIRKYLQHGDTIVEVMISMAVLAVVVGAAYAAATKAFDSSLDSQYRDQGVSYAQQQLELLKEADNSVPSNISMYNSPPNVHSGVPFCIDPSKKSVKSGGLCVNNKFTTDTVYDSSAKEYQVTVSWPAAAGSTQKTILFYKPNDSFAGTVHACTLIGDPACTSTITNPPSVFVSAAQPTIGPGVTDNITWGASNIKAGSCTATGPGTFSSAVDTNADPGTYPFSSATAGTFTFSVNCKDAAGAPVPAVPATVVVSIPTPPAPVINSFNVVNGAGTTIYYGSGVARSLTWSTTNAASCTSNWAGAVGTNSSGTNVTAFPGSSFKLTCDNGSGTQVSATRNISYISSSGYFTCDVRGMDCGCCNFPGPYSEGEGIYFPSKYMGYARANSGIISLWDIEGYCVSYSGAHDLEDFSRTGQPGSYAWDQSFYWDIAEVSVGRDCNGY
jgi:prepilin-type N-terminal cleavage/methylation domain-containing protein